VKRLAEQSFQRIFILTAAILTGSVFLRAIVKYSGASEFGWILALLLSWIALGFSESFLSQRLRHYFPFYIALQTALVFVLLLMPGFSDFFATLLMVLCMQVMLRLKPKVGAFWIGLCAVLLVLVLFKNANYRAQAIALMLVNLAGVILFGSYVVAIRHSQEARVKNESLARQIHEANDSLSALSEQLKQLSLAKERRRLAREMHDSVTQTVFGMSLAAQSAGLMLKSDPQGVEAQLQRIGQLSQSALSEMKVLISELRPVVAHGGLPAALRSFIDKQHFPGNLKVVLYVDGDKTLAPGEEQVLFRIARESLNNAAKYARTGQAEARLHLTKTPSMEIEDKGLGFDWESVRSGPGVGLKSMAEQAAEIGWNMTIISAPGKGSLVRVERKVDQGRKHGGQ
jgi:signal transduction histidine kinase